MRAAGFGLGLALLATASLAETPALPPGYDPVWILQTIDGAPFRAPVTFTLTAPGQFAGQGPCNSYSGTAEGTLPAFHPTSVASTRMACPKLAMEQEYLQLLYAVEQAVLQDGGLVLTTVNGRKLVFSAN